MKKSQASNAIKSMRAIVASGDFAAFADTLAAGRWWQEVPSYDPALWRLAEIVFLSGSVANCKTPSQAYALLGIGFTMGLVPLQSIRYLRIMPNGNIFTPPELDMISNAKETSPPAAILVERELTDEDMARINQCQDRDELTNLCAGLVRKRYSRDSITRAYTDRVKAIRARHASEVGQSMERGA